MPAVFQHWQPRGAVEANDPHHAAKVCGVLVCFCWPYVMATKYHCLVLGFAKWFCSGEPREYITSIFFLPPMLCLNTPLPEKPPPPLPRNVKGFSGYIVCSMLSRHWISASLRERAFTLRREGQEPTPQRAVKRHRSKLRRKVVMIHSSPFCERCQKLAHGTANKCTPCVAFEWDFREPFFFLQDMLSVASAGVCLPLLLLVYWHSVTSGRTVVLKAARNRAVTCINTITWTPRLVCRILDNNVGRWTLNSCMTRHFLLQVSWHGSICT